MGWADRERVLRLLFNRINDQHAAAQHAQHAAGSSPGLSPPGSCPQSPEL